MNKDLTNVTPVTEKFNLDERKDLPLYLRSSSYGNFNPLEATKLRGVKNSDKMMKNKSDYTQRGEK